MGHPDRVTTLVLLASALVVATPGPAAGQESSSIPIGVDSAAYQQWQSDLEDARADRSRSKTYFWAGLGVAVGAPLLGSTTVTYGGGSGTARLISLASTVGAVGAIYGGIVWVQASDRIDELEREGRDQGYLTLHPMMRGGQVDGIRIAVMLPVAFSQ